MKKAFDRSPVLFVLLAGGIAGGWGSGARAEENVAAWAPQDTLLYVGVPSCDQLVASIKKTNGWRAMEDPALKDVVQPFKKLLENGRKLLAKDLGLDSPKELEVYPHGGAVLFVHASPPRGESEEPEPHLGLVMDMGEDLDRAQRLMRRIVQVALDKGGQKEADEIAGIEVTTIRFKADSEEKEDAEEETGSAWAEALLEDVELDEMQAMAITQLLSAMEPPEEFAFAFHQSRLVLGSDTETVKATVKRIRGGGDTSFAASPALRSLRTRCEPKSDVQMVVNLPQLIKLAGDTDADDAREMRAVGLPSLGPLVFTLAFAPTRDVEGQIRGFLEVGPERAGLGHILLMENRQTAPPPSVSADTAVYGSLNVNPSLILKEVLGIATRWDPEKGESMRAGLKATQEDGSVLDIQKDVVDNLSGPLMFTFSVAKPYKAENINGFIALGHKSREAMAKLLAMIPPGMLTSREMLGSTVYEMAMVPGAAGGFTDRVLIPLGTKTAVEAYIRSEGKTGRGLADDPGFQRIARHVPKQSCAVLYIDGLKLADAAAAIAEGGDAAPEDRPGEEATAGDHLRQLLADTFSDMESKDWQARRKYETIAIFTVSTEPEGLRFDAVGVPALTTE